ncbi:hypothetical protein B0H13DRAFT_2174424, partial [Mycena leptocephala]
MIPIPNTEALCRTSHPTSLLPAYSVILPAPSGNYQRKCGRETLILHEQAAGTEVPVYGRGAAVIIEQSTTVADMTLQVTVADRGCMTTSTLRVTYSLWPRDGLGSVCPDTLPFSVLRPLSFRDDNYAIHPLPPSYEISLPGFSREFLLVAGGTGSQTPRLVRASRAFLSDFKPIPEEWRQTLIQLSLFRTSPPLNPSIPIYASCQQLLSFSFRARGLLSCAMPFRSTSNSRVPPALLQHFRTHDGSWKQIIQCSIQRDITVNMYGWPTTCNVSIAQCTPRLCPTQRNVTATLDWDVFFGAKLCF